MESDGVRGHVGTVCARVEENHVTQYTVNQLTAGILSPFLGPAAHPVQVRMFVPTLKCMLLTLEHCTGGNITYGQPMRVCVCVCVSVHKISCMR